MSWAEESLEDPIVLNDKGAAQSKLPIEWKLLPWKGVVAAAQVMTQAAEKYGEDNWRLLSYEEMLPHMFHHMMALWMNEGDTETHLTHLICRALMLYEVLHDGSSDVSI